MSSLINRHLIGLEHTPAHDIQLLIDTGFTFREVLDRPIKKVPSLTGKNIVNLFFENSKIWPGWSPIHPFRLVSSSAQHGIRHNHIPKRFGTFLIDEDEF